MVKQKKKITIYFLFFILIVVSSSLCAMRQAAQKSLPKKQVKQPTMPRKKLLKKSSKSFTEETNQASIKVSSPTSQCYDLMVLMDDNYQEQIGGQNVSLFGIFVQALYEKSFPIIIPNHIVYNVCSSINTLNSQKRDPAELLERAFSFYQLYAIKDSVLNDNDWYCYDCIGKAKGENLCFGL